MTGRRQGGQAKETSLSPKELDAFWDDLASSDAEKAFRAVWGLIDASKQTVPLLSERLLPATPPDDNLIARWIADLNSDEFKVREQARQSLEKLEDRAEPALRAAVAKSPSLEVRRCVQQLLEKFERFPPSPKQLQALRAIEVLEHLATLETRRLLTSLAKGATDARLTQEAKATLERLR